MSRHNNEGGDCGGGTLLAIKLTVIRIAGKHCVEEMVCLPLFLLCVAAPQRVKHVDYVDCTAVVAHALFIAHANTHDKTGAFLLVYVQMMNKIAVLPRTHPRIYYIEDAPQYPCRTK